MQGQVEYRWHYDAAPYLAFKGSCKLGELWLLHISR